MANTPIEIFLGDGIDEDVRLDLFVYGSDTLGGSLSVVESSARPGWFVGTLSDALAGSFVVVAVTDDVNEDELGSGYIPDLRDTTDLHYVVDHPGNLTSLHAGDLRSGVEVGGVTGTLALPSEADVLAEVQYGADGDEYTGTLEVEAQEANYPAEGDVRLGVAYGEGNDLVGELIVAPPRAHIILSMPDRGVTATAGGRGGASSMTILPALQKDPGETIAMSINLAADIQGATITDTPTITTDIGDGDTFAIGSVAAAGKSVAFVAEGGSHDDNHRLDVVAVDSNSNTVHWDALVHIRKQYAQDIIYKQPAESWLTALDLSKRLSGDTIDSVDVSATSGITVTDPVASDGKVYFRLAGGTADNDYEVTVTATTADGQTIVGRCVVRVRTT